ncbi:MAG: cardiolipin synthase [Muribaculaceae bacterium]|nr:cardiolipin synthase [Muribaculaceae bacterium]
MLLYLLVTVSCIVVVLRENRNPIRSMAWVIALITLPVVGLIFYFFFGRSMKGMRMLSRHNKRKLLHNRHNTRVDLESLPLTGNEKSLIKLSTSLSHYPFVINNKIKVFTRGRDKFEALIKDLRNAGESIYFQYYIFTDDEIGRRISDILISKAQEGLKVKVIYDNVGSFSTRNNFFKRMKDAGVDIHPFFRVTFPQLANRINWRNHRKIVIIDNRVGYIGGMNIADRYYRDSTVDGYWRDTHFRVEGEIVDSLIFCFVVDWNFLKKEAVMLQEYYKGERMSNECGMQLVTSGPVENYDNIALTFLKGISGATKRIYIQTPYFLPTDSLLHALEAAALAKIDVRIMIPRKTDSKLLEYASFSYVTQCLKAGIKVYLYEPGMLHSKMMLIDDGFATGGSTNFDFRSFENNFECNIMVYNTEFNSRMREIFFEDLQHCKRLQLTSWRRRPVFHRVMESLVRLFSPIL